MNQTKAGVPFAMADFKPVLKAFSVASSATIVAVFFSVLTNKLISVLAGTEGVAVMGIYRNLGSLIAGTVTLGYSTVISEQLANSRSKEQTNDILISAFFLFLLQCAAGVFALLFFARVLADWVFGHGASLSEVGEVRIVILMSFVNLALQTLVAVLRGKGFLSKISIVQVATAVSSSLLIYPLLKLGRFGLAVNLASGGIVGTLLGIYYVNKMFAPQWHGGMLARGLGFLKRTSGPSILLTLEALVMTGGLLQVQSLINRFYGMDSLGNYNAALLIIDTAILVLMSSVKSYLLPRLGESAVSKEQTKVFGMKLSLLLVAGTFGSLILILCSRQIIALLFTKKFETAVQMLSILSLCMVGQVVNWCCNTLFTQKKNYAAVFGMDTLFIAAFCGLTYYFGVSGAPLHMLTWGYVFACSTVAGLNLFLTAKLYGKEYASFTNLMLIAGCLSSLTLAYWSTF